MNASHNSHLLRVKHTLQVFHCSSLLLFRLPDLCEVDEGTLVQSQCG